jgi:hypothetical protein
MAALPQTTARASAARTNGLTVRRFRNDRRPDGWCPAHVAGWYWCPRRSAAKDTCPADYCRSATSVDTRWSSPVAPRTWHLVRHSGRTRVRNRCDRRPRPSPSGVGLVGVRPAWAAGPCGTGAVRPQTLPDTSAVALHHAVQVPDTCGRTAPSGVRPAVRWLGEPVAGTTAAGGMQPAPVDATKPGGQAAAELAADRGHRRPGERAGLLEGEVVDLRPVTSPSRQR